MLITTGKVHDGIIEIDARELPEGSTVTVLAREGDETFELNAEEKSKLLAAIAEVNRGEVVSAEEVLRRIRKG